MNVRLFALLFHHNYTRSNKPLSIGRLSPDRMNAGLNKLAKHTLHIILSESGTEPKRLFAAFYRNKPAGYGLDPYSHWSPCLVFLGRSDLNCGKRLELMVTELALIYIIFFHTVRAERLLYLVNQNILMSGPPGIAVTVFNQLDF